MISYQQLLQQLAPIKILIKELPYVLRLHSNKISSEHIHNIETLEEYLRGLEYWVEFFEPYVTAQNVSEYLQLRAVRLKNNGRCIKLKPNIEENLFYFKKVISYFENQENFTRLQTSLAEIIRVVEQRQLTVLDPHREGHLGNTPTLFSKASDSYSWRVCGAVSAISKFKLALDAADEPELLLAVNRLLPMCKIIIDTYSITLMFRRVSQRHKNLQNEILELLFKAHFLLTENYTRLVDLGVVQKELDMCLEQMVKFAITNDIITFGDYLLDPVPGLLAENQPLANFKITPEKMRSLNAQLIIVWPGLAADSRPLLVMAEEVFNRPIMHNRKRLRA